MTTKAAAREISTQTSNEIALKVAATREERESAFRLTYESYLRTGLCVENSCQLRITPYQLLPTTDIFVAQLRNETICTLSLVRDGELGLPMEDVFGQQIAERRDARLRLAEVSCLADRRAGIRGFFGTFCDLIGLMAQLAEQREIDQLLIAVHPRHARIYQRCMGYKKIGDAVDYATVEGNLAVPLCLDLVGIQLSSQEIWNKFFGERWPLSALESQPIDCGDRRYFESLLEADFLSLQSTDLDLYQSLENEVHDVSDLQLEASLCA